MKNTVVASFLSVAFFLWILPLGIFISAAQENVACDGKRAFHMCSTSQLNPLTANSQSLSSGDFASPLLASVQPAALKVSGSDGQFFIIKPSFEFPNLDSFSDFFNSTKHSWQPYREIVAPPPEYRHLNF